MMTTNNHLCIVNTELEILNCSKKWEKPSFYLNLLDQGDKSTFYITLEHCILS